MGCDKIEAPQTPELDVSELEGNLPLGKTTNDLKSPVSSTTLSNSLKNTGGLIDTNVKSLGSSLSPAAIASNISTAIGAIADGITSRIDSAVDGLTSLKTRLKSYDPNSFSGKNQPNSAASVIDQVNSSATGAEQALESRRLIVEKNCESQFASKASAVGVDLDNKIQSKANDLTPRERLAALKSPTVAATQSGEISNQVKQETEQQLLKDAVMVDKENRTVQPVTQSDNLVTITTKTSTCNLNDKLEYVRYMMFLQDRYLSMLRGVQIETTSINNYIKYPDRFETTPTYSVWQLISKSITAMTYRKLIPALVDQWKENECGDITPTTVADPNNPASNTFRWYLEKLKGGTSGYSSKASFAPTYDNEIRTTGDEYVDQYFDMWSNSFEYGEDLNIDGTLPTIDVKSDIYKNVTQLPTGASNPGLLSVSSDSGLSNWWSQFESEFSTLYTLFIEEVKSVELTGDIQPLSNLGKDYADAVSVDWSPEQYMIVPVTVTGLELNRLFFPSEIMIQAYINSQAPVKITRLKYMTRENQPADTRLEKIFK